jgi:hypothetical protein
MDNEMVKFNFEITMPKRWMKKFIQMLDCMRWCSNRGSSRVIAFYADGDGDFRPFDFKVNGKELKRTINYSKVDFDFNPPDQDPPVIPPPFKTRRKVDFFFDAG